MTAQRKSRFARGNTQSGTEKKSEGFPAPHGNREMEDISMGTYLAAIVFGFLLGMVFTAVGFLSDVKGGGKE